MSSDAKTRFDVRLRCLECSHEWDEHLDLPMEAGAAIERMDSWLTCPRCGNKSRSKKKAVEWITDQTGLFIAAASI